MHGSNELRRRLGLLGPVTSRVGWTAPVVRDIGRLPAKAAAAVRANVHRGRAENPPRLSEPLQEEMSHLRSAGNGDYRVLFRLDSASRSNRARAAVGR